MTDLSSLSDADLQALYAKSQAPQPVSGDLSHLSDDQLKDLYRQTVPANRFDHMFGANGQDLPTAGQPAPASSDASPGQSWGDVAKAAIGNIGPSAGRFAGDIVGAVSDPVGTAKSVFGLGAGLVEKGYNAVTGGTEPGPHEQYANAVGKMIADRYGSLDALKQTLASDPVGVAADLASVLTGGELAAAKVPMLARAGEVAGTVGRAIDPISNVVRATNTAAKGVGRVASEVTGATSGVGRLPIETAARAGFEGGDASKALTEGMRGSVPMEETLNDAKTALQAIKDQRQAAYQADMADLGKDNTVLNFGNIERAWNSARQTGSFKGISLAPSTAKTVAEVDDVLSQWRNLPPADFHTPVGLDALKQRLGDIVGSVERGSPAEKVATQAYNIVKNNILMHAPEYAKTMASYGKASDMVREIERTLSLNRQANIDTQLRKLQSVMRDGVSTNYGERTKLVQVLQQNGATNIMQKLAGQSLSAIAPRGIARLAMAATDLPALGAVILNPALWPVALGHVLGQSPRVVGEVAHATGKAAKLLGRATAVAVPATRGAFQAGRSKSQ